MKKIRILNHKYPFLKKDISIDITTNPCDETETQTYPCHHIRYILEKPVLVTVTVNNLKISESDINIISDTVPKRPLPLGSVRHATRGHDLCHSTRTNETRKSPT